jgi:SAM-dependent methyltransferase
MLEDFRKRVYLKRRYISIYIKLFSQFGGLKYHCPFCGFWFRKFLPFGLNNRPNARCPVCGSLERHRAAILYLKKHTELFSKERKKLLHFAPERCFQKLFAVYSSIEYISADLSSPRASENWDITKIPAQDESFDTILCSHVLEHVPEDGQALKELFRVLKKGGDAILQVPILRKETFEDPAVVDPQERERVYGQRDHVRTYGLDFIRRVENAGFRVRMEELKHILGEKQMRLYAIPMNEKLFFCQK